jgi:hypothetical protein
MVARGIALIGTPVATVTVVDEGLTIVTPVSDVTPYYRGLRLVERGYALMRPAFEEARALRRALHGGG